MKRLGAPEALILPALPGWGTELVGEWQAHLTGPDGVGFTLSRAARSPLADAYPSSHTDVVAQVDVADGTADETVAEAVRALVAATWEADPQCRRLVVPVPSEQTHLGKAVQDGGLRYVLMVEARDGTEYAVHVAEPAHVTAITGELDTMPED